MEPKHIASPAALPPPEAASFTDSVTRPMMARTVPATSVLLIRSFTIQKRKNGTAMGTRFTMRVAWATTVIRAPRVHDMRWNARTTAGRWVRRRCAFVNAPG